MPSFNYYTIITPLIVRIFPYFGNAGVYNYMCVYVSTNVVVGGTMYNHVRVCRL